MPSKFFVREARRERGISVPEIADRLGVSESAVWNWDRGKSRPRPELAKRLSVLLGIDSALFDAPFKGGGDCLASDEFLTCAEILGDTKARLAKKLGLPESSFEISLNIKR